MSAETLDFELLPWQEDVWKDSERFKVIAAGRRTGKTRFAIYQMLFHALNATKGHTFYVAPTQGQARDICWKELHDIGRGVITKSHVNNLQVQLINGQTISLKGADRPDTLRGVSLNFLVLDEFADMKQETWDEILRPALSDQMAPAVFIGTPKGRNHFFDIYSYAEVSGDEDWKAYHYTSFDNPFIPEGEVLAAKKTLSTFAFEQEYMANFKSRGSEIFSPDWVKQGPTDSPEFADGDYYIAVDLAGFEEEGPNKKQRRDNTAIAVVKVGREGWFVEDVIYGRWTLKETASKIFGAWNKYKPQRIGIEKGIAKQAVMSPLTDLMRQRGRYFRIEELSHGNKHKVDRIVWALQGRLEHGQITINKEGEWVPRLLDELFSFPDSRVHDDLIDALSYIDQLAVVIYDDHYFEETWEPLDGTTGF